MWLDLGAQRNQSCVREDPVLFSDCFSLVFSIVICNVPVQNKRCPNRRWSHSSFRWVRQMNGEARLLQHFIITTSNKTGYFSNCSTIPSITGYVPTIYTVKRIV